MSRRVDLTMKRGDRRPTLLVVLEGDGDLTDATSVRFLMSKPNGATKVNTAATIANAADSRVLYEWAAADVNEAGRFHAEFEVTYSDGRKGTFPSDGFFIIEFDEDLGDAP